MNKGYMKSVFRFHNLPPGKTCDNCGARSGWCGRDAEPCSMWIPVRFAEMLDEVAAISPVMEGVKPDTDKTCESCGDLGCKAIQLDVSEEEDDFDYSCWIPDEISEEKEGVKHDTDKLNWSLVPWESMKEVLKVLMFGAKKYPAADNWKKVDNGAERYWEAAMRHIIDIQTGEEEDPESGLSHAAHAVCCLLFYLYFKSREEE